MVPLSPAIKRLKQWRYVNHLSQRQAIDVMKARDFKVALTTLQAWEQRNIHPGHFTEKALDAFLEQFPTITDAPTYGRWVTPEKKIAEIHKLRKTGATLASIGEKFGLSESAVSRICAGNRRAKGI
jgi:transcriptional regulator with XRE-family HTH domain